MEKEIDWLMWCVSMWITQKIQHRSKKFQMEYLYENREKKLNQNRKEEKILKRSALGFYCVCCGWLARKQSVK